MKKLSDEHLKSIDRTITIMKIHCNRQKVPKYQKELDRDIKHLLEICVLVKDRVNNPMFDHIDSEACELTV